MWGLNRSISCDSNLGSRRLSHQQERGPRVVRQAYWAYWAYWAQGSSERVPGCTNNQRGQLNASTGALWELRLRVLPFCLSRGNITRMSHLPDLNSSNNQFNRSIQFIILSTQSTSYRTCPPPSMSLCLSASLPACMPA